MGRYFGKCFLMILLSLVFLASNGIGADSTLSSVPEPKDLTVPILCYHAVLPEAKSIYTYTPEQLEADFIFLKEHGYHPITAVQFIKMEKKAEYFPSKPVVLSFDDGNKSAYTHVLPLLKKYGFQATFFVFPKDLREESDRYLTWRELSEIALSGMDIESHSKSHPFLTINTKDNPKVYQEWLDQELKGSKDILENRLHRKVTLLAYPFGWYNSIVETEAIKAGYQGIFTVNWGNNGPNENLLRFKRRVMVNSTTPEEFERILTMRPLEINIISPTDTSIERSKPVIKFSLSNPEIKTVELAIRRTKVILTADSDGYFTLSRYHAPKPRGYCMIIVKGYDTAKNLYMGSWGFDFEPVPEVRPTESPAN